MQYTAIGYSLFCCLLLILLLHVCMQNKIFARICKRKFLETVHAIKEDLYILLVTYEYAATVWAPLTRYCRLLCDTSLLPK